MAYVTFTYKNGTKRRMPERDAKILTKLKKGSVLAEAEAAAPIPAEPEKQPEPPVIAPAQEPQASDGLDEMDREQLLSFAKDLGIKIHGRTGEEKAREIIREHTK